MKKSILALLLAVLMVASLLPAAAMADGGITVNGEGSYANLQAALEEAHDGDIIEFKAGVYDIGSVSTDKLINIKGAGAGVTTLSGTIVYNFAAPQTGNISISGITLVADTSTVQGIQFRATGHIEESDLDISISNCAFDGWKYALTMNSHANGYNMTVSGCDFSDSLYAVSYSHDTITAGQTNNNSLKFGANNVINPNGFAVQKFNNQVSTSEKFSDKTYETVDDFVADKAVSGRVRYVSANGSIQDAVNDANDGDVIVVAPGTYNEVVTFGGKSLTIKAQNYAYANGFKLNDESKLSKFTGTFYTGAGSNPGSFKENQSITIIGFALSGNGLKIGTTNWSTVGSLTVKNCTMEFGTDLESTSYYNKSNKFICVNGGANGAFADFVVEDNFVKGTPSGSNNPIQLWGVQNATVANNMIILNDAATFEAIGISKLASDAKINVYGNTIFGAGTGVSITTWLCNNDSTGETAFKGDVSIENNTFTNVNKPIFVGYEKVDNVPYAAFEGTLNYDGNTNNGVTVIPELGQKPGATAYYTVKVDPANGGKVDVSTVPSGSTFTTYGAPNNPGYAFLGWACSDGKTYSALQEVTITANTTFTASWVRHADVPYVPEPEEPEEPEVPEFPFYDVPTSAWYYSAVKYVYDNKLMDGVDTYVFAPNDTLTRAMVWTIIARMSGVDTTGGANWYAKAQEWVVVNGISDGENPTAAITRQELVTMLYRYAQIKGYDVSVGESTNILSYVDATSISEYAMSAFQWACGSGLTEGDENGALTPLATATRAQAAAMIMRFLSK